MSKKCSKCQQTKNLSEFAKKTKNKFQSICKVCHKEYASEHYKKNKTIYKERAKISNQKIMERNIKFINEQKNSKCVDCKKKYPYWVMDFDHLVPEKKEDNISTLARNGASLNRIIKEIRKCDLVCSNCHRDRTHKRRSRFGETVDTSASKALAPEGV